MPLTFSASVKARLGIIGGIMPVWLLDLVTVDDTKFYFAEAEGSYPKVIDGPADGAYLPWLKSAGPLKTARDTRTDAADCVISNLSGNTIERDMWLAFKAHEFEGALAVLRLWEPLEQYALREFHCSVTEPDSDWEEFTFRLTQLQDPNAYVAPSRYYSEQCTWRYKSAPCGSTSGLATCPKTVSACAARGARERFNGIPFTTPATAFTGGLG